MWHFLGADSADPTWYRRPEGSTQPSALVGNNLAMFGTQAVFDILTCPQLYEIFNQLHDGQRKLWCSWTGNVLCKPPANPDVPIPPHLLQPRPAGGGPLPTEMHPGWGGEHGLHWDLQAAERRNGGYSRPGAGGQKGRWQSVLCLEDTPADRGGWWCVPGFHKLWADLAIGCRVI